MGIDKQIFPQWEATKRSVGLSTAGVVDAHRVWYQRRWTATVRHLIYVNVRRNGIDRNGNRHRKASTTVEVIWRRKSTTILWARSAACIRSLAKLIYATLSVTPPANWLQFCFTKWAFVHYRKYWKDSQLFLFDCRRPQTSSQLKITAIYGNES